jgi:hypothetical protein
MIEDVMVKVHKLLRKNKIREAMNLLIKEEQSLSIVWHGVNEKIKFYDKITGEEILIKLAESKSANYVFQEYFNRIPYDIESFGRVTKELEIIREMIVEINKFMEKK